MNTSQETAATPVSSSRTYHHLTPETVKPVSNEFMQFHEGLVRFFVRLVINRFDCHAHKADLLQEGRFALFVAYQTYDPTKINPATGRSYKFSTYAVKRVYWHLTRYLAQMRAPVSFKNMASKAGGQRELESLGSRIVSLNEPLPGLGKDGEDLSIRQDFLIDETQEDLCDRVDRVNREECVQAILKGMNLTPRETDIIEMRLMCEPPATLEEIGNIHGISKERVRQVEVKLLVKLKRRFERYRDQLT